MIPGIGNSSPTAVPDSVTMERTQAQQVGGELHAHQDSKESATAPKFGEIYNQIQAKFGKKADKPREIKKTLGKDDFLKIMLAQMKNQDPTSPFKAEQMATQVAQFTSVEQLQNVNQNLNKLGAQNKPLEQMVMTNMIGKTVTIDRQRFPHTEGETDSLSFHLPENAETARVSVVTDTGEEIFSKDLGFQKAGEIDFLWDGIKVNSLPAKTGNYSTKIEAKNSRGQTIEIDSRAKTKVIGVSFDGVEPILLVGDSKHQEKTAMRNIVRVEMDLSADAGKGQAMIPEVNQPKVPNFISFQKGVGSANFNPAEVTAAKVPAANNVARALESYQQEKGFPNGLSENNEPQKGGEQQ